MKYADKFFALLWLVSLVACGDQVSVGDGYKAKLRVIGGQFTDERFPIDVNSDASVPSEILPDGGIADVPPQIEEVDTASSIDAQGTANKTIHLLVGPNAASVALKLDSDPGYWLVPVTLKSIEFAPNRELSMNVELDRSIPVGPIRIWFSAADEHGRFGPAKSLDLMITSDLPTAPLVVSLTWTENMDLDLVVKQADGTLLTNKIARVNASNPPTSSIDLDSNAMCVIDGHREENAAFTAVPAGMYSVYVRLASACGIPETAWKVRLYRDGNLLQTARGETLATEVTVPNGGPNGPGRLAMSFNIGD